MAKYLLVAVMCAALAACGMDGRVSREEADRMAASQADARCTSAGLNPDCTPRSAEVFAESVVDDVEPPVPVPPPAQAPVEQEPAASPFPQTYDLRPARCEPPRGVRPCRDVAILNDDISPARACDYMVQVMVGICAPEPGASPLEANGTLTGTPDGDIRYETVPRR